MGICRNRAFQLGDIIILQLKPSAEIEMGQDDDSYSDEVPYGKPESPSTWSSQHSVGSASLTPGYRHQNLCDAPLVVKSVGNPKAGSALAVYATAPVCPQALIRRIARNGKAVITHTLAVPPPA
ncbi:hypothetical protein C8J56DRAFT_889121 [Mycena floridula]|nr:hypothetical protein C8J56DRAFT_889121 [Mycena floridula]